MICPQGSGTKDNTIIRRFNLLKERALEEKTSSSVVKAVERVLFYTQATEFASAVKDLYGNLSNEELGKGMRAIFLNNEYDPDTMTRKYAALV